MKRDKKAERLAQLAQLMQLYQGYQQGELQQQLGQFNLQSAQQEQPLRMRGQEADIAGKEQQNEFAGQMQPQQLAMLMEQLKGMGIANTQAQAMNPLALENARIGNRTGAAQASIAEVGARNAPEQATLGLQGMRSGLQDSEDRRKSEKVRMAAVQQQMGQSQQAFPLEQLGRGAQVAGMGGNPQIAQAAMQQLGLSGPPAEQASMGDPNTLGPLQEAIMHEQMFNQGKLNPAQLGQFAPVILQGMAADPQRQWPDMFQAMQYYNQNADQFHAPTPVNPPPKDSGFMDMFSGGPASGVMQKAIQGAIGPAPEPQMMAQPHWDTFSRTSLQDEVLRAFLHNRQMQQIQKGIVR